MRALTGIVSLVLAGGLQATADDFHWSERLAAGKTLEVKGVNGDIRAVAASGEAAEVSAKKHGRRSNPAEVEIKVVPHSGGVTICAVYPGSWWGRSNECAPGKHGRIETRDNDVTVEFEVRVPAGVTLVARTVNGDVEATGLPAGARVSSVNGDVGVSAAGVVAATTVNGSVTATMGRADWKGDAHFESVNGGVTVMLPSGADTEVAARTVSGDIRTDFPLSVTGRHVGRRMTGTLGSGGRELILTTVNGSIRLEKAH